MARIIIIGEGQTEQSFCNDLLQTHLNAKGIYLHNAIIKRTGGGIVRWPALKHQIERHLLQDRTAVVTTLIDYYGLHQSYMFPKWREAHNQLSLDNCVALLESGMHEEIPVALRQRFIPYIQLHEFEGLLFSDLDAFRKLFEDAEFTDYDYLVTTIDMYENPELINNNPTTAPSKRLDRILKSYNKIVHGSLIAQKIGLTAIRTKCPRFNHWVEKLESADDLQ